MINRKLVDTDILPEENLLFFGKKSKIIRVDKVSHEIFKILKEISEGNTWFTKEVDMKQDRTSFEKLKNPNDIYKTTPPERIFKLNIAYQTIMDSAVTGGIPDMIIQCVSSSMLELLYRRISTEEAIHSESYSYGLMEVFGQQASGIIDLVYNDSFVKNRMKMENELFLDLFKTLTESEDLEEKKKALLKVLIGLYCLEGIKFPYSFLITFIINDRYDNAIPGFCRTIQLIAHDELNVHLPTTQNIWKILSTDKTQGFIDLFQSGWFTEEYKKLVDKTIEMEKEWADYLFEDSSIKGLNLESSIQFLEWRKYHVTKILTGEKFDIPGLNEYISDLSKIDFNSNPLISFFENYRAINKQNSALQETSNVSYEKGNLKNDLSRIDGYIPDTYKDGIFYKTLGEKNLNEGLKEFEKNNNIINEEENK